MAATSVAMPARARVTRAPEALPCRASRARASTGRPSLAKVFQTPETSTATEIRDPEYPQDRSML